MDLKNAETALARLEHESAHIETVGVMRRELGELSARLSEVVQSAEGIKSQLDNANAALLGTADSVQAKLKELQGELDGFLRQIDERMRTQINSATTQYETLVRTEVRSIVDRIELNQRELKQILEQTGSSVDKKIDDACSSLQSRQRNGFRLLLTAITLFSSVLIGLVIYFHT